MCNHSVFDCDLYKSISEENAEYLRNHDNNIVTYSSTILLYNIADVNFLTPTINLALVSMYSPLYELTYTQNIPF